MNFVPGINGTPMFDKLETEFNLLCNQGVKGFDLLADKHPPSPDDYSEKTKIMYAELRRFTLTAWMSNKLKIHIKTDTALPEPVNWEQLNESEKLELQTDFDLAISILKALCNN